ncbi:MAG TPA: MBOAT family O-acyltransferase [Acetobacteraceae bacterium]|nr:MBOAT family O-acyltransferase [Acetobacteraceae bacterium]
MLFNSYAFLLGFLPASVAVFALIHRKQRLRIPSLLAFSLLFYGYWNPPFVLLLIGSILVNWLAARQFVATRNNAFVTGAIVLNLGVLGVFKYADFFAGSVAAIGAFSIGRLDFVLPLGISFFTFHHIMYLADLRRGRAEATTLPRYALYISFFPQAIAGPLARWSEVGRQFGRDATEPGWEQRCALGVTFIVVGLIEKVALGDPIGRILDPIYHAAASGPVHDGSAWLALGFGCQIFFDFAGYSDIAIGTAMLFGIRLPFNFNAPFRATSILVFWQRWHMTLSRFLRDYVFMPLADLRIAGYRHTTVQYVLAIMLTMALCGLWHGAGWNFVLWGTLQGAGIVFALGWRRMMPAPPKVLSWAATVVFFLLSCVVFRTATLGASWNIYSGLASLPDAKILSQAWIVGVGLVLAVALPATQDLCNRIALRPVAWVPAALGAIGIALLIQIGSTESYEFIYFRF